MHTQHVYIHKHRRNKHKTKQHVVLRETPCVNMRTLEKRAGLSGLGGSALVNKWVWGAGGRTFQSNIGEGMAQLQRGRDKLGS